MPPAEFLSRGKTQLVTQSFIVVRENFELKTLKITVNDITSHLLVSKTTNGENRDRSDVPINVEQYDFLKNIPNAKWITKYRTGIIDGEFALKFDDFEDTVLGKIFMLELDVAPNSNANPKDYIFPDAHWTKDMVDVSGDARYFNQNLAMLKK